MNRWVPSPLTGIWLIALSLTLNLVSFDLARAAEETFSDFNVAITPPDGWQKMPPKPDRPSIVANFRNPTNTAAIFLIVKDAGKLSVSHPPTIKTAAARPPPSTFHRIAWRLLRFKLAVAGVGIVMLVAIAIGVMLMLKRSGSRGRDRGRRHSS